MLSVEGEGVLSATSMVYKLADMILLRITQAKENGSFKAHGELQWAVPWGGERVELFKKARVRMTGDGALFVYLECIGNLDIVAGIHENGRRFFLLCDSSKGQPDLPEKVDNIVDFITDLSPSVVVAFHKNGDGAWEKIKRKPSQSASGVTVDTTK